MRSNSKAALLWLLFILICLVVLLRQTVMQSSLPVESNILALLPENQQDAFSQQAFTQITDNLNNKVVFLLSGADKSRLVEVADNFSKGLSDNKLFSGFQAQLSEQDQSAWGSLYFPYRHQLLNKQQQLRLEKSTSLQVEHVIQQVYNPFSGVTGRELENDPFLLFRDYLSSKNSSSANFSLYKGYPVTQYQGKTYLIIQANLAGDAYDTSLQSHLPSLIELENRIKNKFDVQLLHTGTLFYAAYGVQSAKGEISTIGLGSLVGIILLLLLVYRSVLPLTLALLSIGCGLLVAFVVTVAVFGKVHLFSLVFGASLIGVSIDYAFHYLTERLVNKGIWDAQLALKHIFNAITLGLVTSLIGYLGLLITPFPGLQQLSLFSVVGLLAAYLTVVLCYPFLASSPSKAPVPKLQVIKLWLALWGKPQIRIVLPGLFLLFCALALPSIYFDDDIRQLQVMPDVLKEQEKQIKTVTGAGENQQLLLVKADNEEALLIRLEVLSEQFAQWQKSAVLLNYQSISQYVPSIKKQQENYQLIASLYDSQKTDLQQSLGFSDEIKHQAVFAPLLIDDYLASTVSDSLGFLWLDKIEEKSAAIVILNQVYDQQLVQQYIEAANDLSSLDKADEISAIFASYRVYISELLVFAYLLVGLLLCWRYSFKLAIRVLIPPMIAACVGLAVTSAAGIPITIFNLLALILILGIGIDYTLFFAELKESDKAKSTLLAITLSAITTILSFGLLALSETQAIHGFGITVLSGIVVAWILAPLAMPLTEQEKAK